MESLIIVFITEVIFCTYYILYLLGTILSTYCVLGVVSVTHQGKSQELGSGDLSRRKKLGMLNEEGERGQWARAKAGKTGWDQMMKDPGCLSLPSCFCSHSPAHRAFLLSAFFSLKSNFRALLL